MVDYRLSKRTRLSSLYNLLVAGGKFPVGFGGSHHRKQKLGIDLRTLPFNGIATYANAHTLLQHAN